LEERDRPIYELGDGIQSAIILSFLPFVMKEPSFFFIEEPESHLHPGLQRKLLEFFSNVPEHKFFLTAHSNHLLDVTIDIKDLSVFTFRKHLDLDSEDEEQSPTFTVENVDASHRSSLELLGVRNSSVFLVNATIWVEGITDRWYLRSMLNSYINHIAENGNLPLKAEEDVHYCFVEYGGGNITHWSFLDYEEHPIEVERLCSRALLVVDQDGESKLQRKEDLQNNMGERLITLPCREIENALPYEIIKAVVLELEKTPERELPDFELEDYQDKYLGRFIEDEMLQGQKQRRGSYAAPSGTIKSKVDFCERSIKKIRYETLSESTQALVQQIYQFICQMNT
jgi:predicted ATP-dependent endonuclease of OLD family